MLEERFERFADETRRIGTERLSAVNEICDQLIGTGHTDSELIGEWREELNDKWQQLLEMMQTRQEVSIHYLILTDLSLIAS